MTKQISRKAFSAATEALGEKRQVRVVISTDQPDRVGDVMVQDGIDLSSFKNTRTVLWNHDQDHPVASCLEIGLVSGKLQALVQFPDEGVSAKADEVYGLIKAGVINAASIGFLPLDGEPADGKNPRNGMRISKSELLEFSFVSVPANPGATIQERAMPATKTKTKTVGKITVKGLWACGELASLLSYLGYMAEDAAWEREIEGDESTMPEVLTAICHQVGAALQAMTAEEVGELLAGLPGQDNDIDIDVIEEKGVNRVLKALKHLGRGLAPVAAVEKAGRTLSAATSDALSAACKSIKEGHDSIKAMIDDATTDDAATTSDDGKKALASAQARAKRIRNLEISAL